MSLKLGSINNSRPRTFQGGNGGGAENVAVMIAEVHSDKKTANPAEDYAIAYLLEDGFGKKAEFKPRDPSIENEADDTEFRTPMTSIKVMMKDRTIKGEFTPLEIHDLQAGKRKGVAMPMGQFPTVILENAWHEQRTDTVKVGWLTVGQRDYSNTNERVITDVLVTVEREHTDDRNNKQRQYRNVIEASHARTFKSLEDLKAIAVDMLSDTQQASGGRPAVMVRILQNDTAEIAKGELITSFIYPAWDSNANAHLSPEASFDLWVSGDRISDEKMKEAHAQFIGAVEQAGTAGYTFEAIPTYRYTTGELSLPSKKAKGIDDADNFRMPMVDRKTGETVMRNDGKGPMTVSGFAEGTMLVQRVSGDDSAPWFATKTFRKQRFGAIYPREEVVTPNLPADIKAYFVDRATKRGAEARAAVKDSKAERAPAAAQDDEIGFGEPDHAGGLTPS